MDHSFISFIILYLYYIFYFLRFFPSERLMNIRNNLSQQKEGVYIMKNLKHLRTSHNLSQSELSRMLHISQQSICKYESGHSEANETLLIKTASFFGTSVDYLLGLSDSPTDSSDHQKKSFSNHTPEETFHLNLYRNVSREQQQAVDTLLKGCCNHSSKK